MIKEWLSRLEDEYQIDILFACEAGSRAWNIESATSDHDVRFIYRHRDMKNYLALRKAPDVLDWTSPYDATGFDIYKTLDLILKSNPGIYEWAFSPAVYMAAEPFTSELKGFIRNEYSPFSLYKHYQSLRTRNLKEVQKKVFNASRQKQLIHAVRAELISSGILLFKEISSPFEMIRAAEIHQPELFEGYQLLASTKRNNQLLSEEQADSIIHLLAASYEYNELGEELSKKQPSLDLMEQWLREILGIL